MLIAYQGIADGRKLEMWGQGGVPGKFEESYLHKVARFHLSIDNVQTKSPEVLLRSMGSRSIEAHV